MALGKKEKIQFGIIAIMMVLMIVKLPSFIRSIQGTSQQNTTSATPEVADLPAAVPDFLKAMVAQVRSGNGADPSQTDLRLKRASQLALMDQPWGRDPFFGIIIGEREEKPDASSGQQDLVLQAVSLKGKKAMAIINQTVVREGDEVFGMRVHQIQRDRVVFSGGEREMTLRFGGTT